MEAKPDADERRMVKLSTPSVRSYVSTGNDQEDSQPETTTNAMNALHAENRTMEPSSVLMHRRINALTPYKAKTW
jgi:hypothetical protein